MRTVHIVFIYFSGSIHASHVVVGGGLRWCVGNGRKISVWKDAWSREKDSYNVTSMINSSLYASDLIEPNRTEWRKRFIEENFNVRDASSILSIPLYKVVDQEDIASSKFSPTEFTV